MLPIKILLVEDNPGDVELTRIGLEDACIANSLTVINDGQQAIDLFEQGTGLPDLVLLDINLPKVDGLEVLHKIRSMEHSKHIHVVMLTSSEADVDIKGSFKNKANGYITKPVKSDNFYQIVKSSESLSLCVISEPTLIN